MALLTLEKRKEYFAYLGLGEYNSENLKKVQKKYMERKSDVDGEYGTNSDNLLRHLYNVKKYTKNFKPEEFKCECNGRHCCGYPTYMKPVELQHIQTIRDHFGKPITITCGMRCKGYNRELNGSIQNSLHLQGYAIDFYQAGVTDTLANRKKSIKYIKVLPGHHYTYGNGINSYGASVSASYMGNALHTDTQGSVAPSDGKLNVDGIGGAATVKAMQRFFGTGQDGVISGQNASQGKYYPSLTAVEYGNGGSVTIKKLQKWVGATEDGVLGKTTVKKWQKKLGVVADGIFGKASMKAWQKYLNANDKAVYPTAVAPSPSPPVADTSSAKVYKVIDVSDWQSKIDWAKVKKAGIDGAIIRYADGNTLDKRFAENMKNAKANGIHIGAYIFSRAKSKADAEKEAERLFKACKPYDPDMPLYIDLEANTLSQYADTVAEGFLNKIKALGGWGGVYANLNWWNNYLKKTIKNYSASPFWIAQYNSKMTHKNPSLFGMWQYTSSGKVDGISGKVDRDHCYVAYWQEKPTLKPIPVEKKGYEYSYPTSAEIKTASNAGIRKRMCEWAKKIAKSGEYKYKKWSKTDKETHKCPICSKQDGKYKGWNCIGYAFAAWKHGGGLKSKCNCHVIDNGTWAKMLKMSDAEALKTAQDRIGLKDLKVIRNDGKSIPASKLQAGDIIGLFYKDLHDCKHIAMYMGNGKVADSTSGRTPNISASASYSSYNSKYPCMVAIRYTGGHTYLERGDEGEAVKKLQQYLNWFGNYGLTTDGIWGNATEEAVKDMQKKLGVKADALVGTDTLNAMKAYKK